MQSEIKGLQECKIICEICDKLLLPQQIVHIQFNSARMYEQIWSTHLSCLNNRSCIIRNIPDFDWDYKCKLPQENLTIMLSLQFPRLQELNLYKLKLNDQCCVILTKNNWPCLCRLSLNYNEIEDQGFNNLMMHKWDRLYGFSIIYNRIKNGDLNFKNQRWQNLSYLHLDNNIIIRKGIKTFMKAGLSYLIDLTFDQCGIDDEGLVELSKGPWRKLDLLVISSKGPTEMDGRVSNRGLRHLRFANWQKFKYLRVQYSGNCLNVNRYAKFSICLKISSQSYNQDRRLVKYYQEEAAKMTRNDERNY